MLRIRDFYESGEYDEIIIDCAPTGETLSLLKFPDMLGKLITGFIPTERKIVNKVGPAVEKMTKIPMPKSDVFDEILDLNGKLERLRNILHSPDTNIRIVTTPERVVLLEAKKNFRYLKENGFNVDEIIVNRIYPDAAMAGYFSKWLDMQKKALDDIDEYFRVTGGVNISHKYLCTKEIYGVEALLAF